jgi:hypothetical protein
MGEPNVLIGSASFGCIVPRWGGAVLWTVGKEEEWKQDRESIKALKRAVFEGSKPFAEEDGEGVLLLPGKGLEQSRLICHMRDQRAVNEFATLFGQFDQNAAPIFRIRYASHKPFFCQPVDAIGHRSRCHHHRAKEFGGRESIRCSGTAQGRQHIEAPVVQAELRKYRLQFLLHDERQPGNAANYAHGGDVEIRTFSSPLGQNATDMIFMCHILIIS